MRSKIRNIPVRHANGKAIGTAEVEYDSEAAGCWLEIVLDRHLARDMVHGMEIGTINGLTLDASYTSVRPAHVTLTEVEVNKHGVGYVPPEYDSDGKAYEGSVPPSKPGYPIMPPFDLAEAMRQTKIPPTVAVRGGIRYGEASVPPVDPTHPHYADFDLDPNNRTLGEEEINSRFGFHKATIEGPEATAPRHAYLRNEFKTFADMLDRVLPPGRYKNLVMTSLEEASMWSHKSIAEKAPAGE